MLAGQFCVREYSRAFADETVHTAVERMASARADFVVVIDEHDRPLGILQGRELILQVMAGTADTTTVGELINDEPALVQESTAAGFALSRMYELCVSHLLVVRDNGVVTGVLSRDAILSSLGRGSASLPA